jgi:hypothetical protein
VSYTTALDKLTGKDIVVVYDFPDLTTRFVSDQNASGLSNPPGWTIFTGAKPEAEDGSSYDAKSGRLKVGGQAFSIPDKSEAVTAWVASHDTVDLALTRVTMRSGFRNTAEAEWPTQELVLDDYVVEGRHGGGYKFELGNVLVALGASLFESVGGGAVGLDEISHVGGLDPASTFIVTDDEMADWPSSGYALLSCTASKQHELVHYDSIGRIGILLYKLENVTRQVYGVGTGYAFPETSGLTTINPVWILRGGVGELAFRVATTTDAAGTSTPVDVGNNPRLENWSSDTDLDYWTESVSGGSVNREISDHIVGFNAVRLDRTAGGSVSINRILDVTLIPGKWYTLSLIHKADQILTGGLEFRLMNSTQSLDLDTDGTGVNWVSGARYHAFDAGTDVRRATITFKWDSSFPGTDTTYIAIRHALTGVYPSSLWIDIGPYGLFRGPYDSQPNGPFDAGDGNGLGVDIDYFNIDHAEDILQTYWPHPTFTAAGDTDTGDGALYVELKKISNVRTWMEDLVRSFGLKPVVDNQGRWTIDKLYRIPPDEVVIDDEWRSSQFRARWKRGYADAVNSITFGTDWDASEDEYNKEFPAAVDEDSIDAFGKSEPVELETRGLRTGRLGYPDLNGETIARKAATRVLLELANPSTPIDIEAFLKYKDVSLLHTVTLIVPGIPDLVAGTRQSGSRTFHTVRISVNLGKGFVKMRVRERRVLNRPAIIGPNDLFGVTYSSATETQKQYCAVAPDANGFPSDSTLPYTVPP